jgi:hypothetical protein
MVEIEVFEVRSVGNSPYYPQHFSSETKQNRLISDYQQILYVATVEIGFVLEQNQHIRLCICISESLLLTFLINKYGPQCIQDVIVSDVVLL